MNTPRINLTRLPADEHARLLALAVKEGRSIANMATQLVREGMRAREKGVPRG